MEQIVNQILLMRLSMAPLKNNVLRGSFSEMFDSLNIITGLESLWRRLCTDAKNTSELHYLKKIGARNACSTRAL